MKERLKQFRNALGLKQRDIAEKLGVGVSVVGRWETGLDVPKTRIYQLCKEYNVNRHWLETGEGEMFEPDQNFVSMFVALYDALPSKYQEAFQKVAEEVLDIKKSG